MVLSLHWFARFAQSTPKHFFFIYCANQNTIFANQFMSKTHLEQTFFTMFSPHVQTIFRSMQTISFSHHTSEQTTCKPLFWSTSHVQTCANLSSWFHPFAQTIICLFCSLCKPFWILAPCVQTVSAACTPASKPSANFISGARRGRAGCCCFCSSARGMARDF